MGHGYLQILDTLTSEAKNNTTEPLLAKPYPGGLFSPSYGRVSIRVLFCLTVLLYIWVTFSV